MKVFAGVSQVARDDPSGLGNTATLEKIYAQRSEDARQEVKTFKKKTEFFQLVKNDQFG